MLMVARACKLVCLLLVLSLASCQKYRLELRPVGDVLQRDLAAWEEATDSDSGKPYDPFPEAQLSRLAAVYGAPVPKERAARHEFSGQFKGRLPAELGGSGWYQYDRTAMGSVALYMERFAGDDRISAGLDRARVALDRLVDIWLLWLDAEFSADPDFPSVHRLFDEAVRRDLHDLLTYVWAFDTLALNIDPAELDGGEEQAMNAFALRLVLFLAERGYLDPNALPPELVGLFYARGVGEVEPARLREVLVRSAAARMGVTPEEPLPGPLAALSETWPIYRSSLEAFMTASEPVLSMAEAWNAAARRTDTWISPATSGEEQPGLSSEEVVVLPEASYVDPGKGSILHQLADIAFMEIIEGGFYDVLDELVVTLYAPPEVFMTNGEQRSNGTVRWEVNVSPEGQTGNRLPAVVFAAWSEPDADFQQEHFGDVILRGRPLAAYHYWYRALSPRRTAEWDLFLASLRPGAGLDGRLAEFCFTDEPACGDDGAASRILSELRSAIRSAAEEAG